MVRSRSRSPRRATEKRRSRSRDRERDRERDRDRRRHKSRSPRRRSRSRSPRRRRSPGTKRRSSSRDNDVVITGTSQLPPGQLPTKSSKANRAAKVNISVPEAAAAAMEGKSEEEIEMMKLMGFGGFDSTKGKQVPGADISATNVIQKRKYRQYMNRRGGFNRPLDFVA